MSADNEKLWVVENKQTGKLWVFRTRAAARMFASTLIAYVVSRATWGPEQ